MTENSQRDIIPALAPRAVSSWSIRGVWTKLLLAFLGALGAAVAPVTTHIREKYELRLKAQAQEHAFQKDFLEKALSPDAQSEKPKFRQPVLEFFAAVLEKGTPLQEFARMKRDEANEEIVTLQAKLSVLQKEKEDAEKRAEKRDSEKQNLEATIDGLKSSKAASQGQLRKAKAELDRNRAEIVKAKAEAALLSQRAGEIESRLPPEGSQRVVRVGDTAFLCPSSLCSADCSSKNSSCLSCLAAYCRQIPRFSANQRDQH